MKRFSILVMCVSVVFSHVFPSESEIKKTLHKNLVSLDKNPFQQVLLTKLRDSSTTCSDFQEASDKLANYLVFKSSECLALEKKEINTPVGPFSDGVVFKKDPILVPIFRSGLSLLPIFQEYFKGATVGFCGIKRNEQTAQPILYYLNLPPITQDDQILILEPMLATGGSLHLAISLLKEAGALEKNIIIVSVISASQGIERFEKEFPEVRIITAALDEALNEHFYIVPGLGDYGDRYFGNDSEPYFKQLDTVKSE